MQRLLVAWRSSGLEVDVADKNDKVLITDVEKRFRDRQTGWVKLFSSRLRADGHLTTDTATALFERSLAKILATPFDRRYPKLIALELMAPPEYVELGAASVISQGHEIRGEATLTSSYQTEIAMVEIVGREHEMLMHGLVAKWFLGYQQIAHAAFSRVPLPTRLARAAYRVIAEGMDHALSIGDASAGIKGMANVAAVPKGAGGGAVFTGTWATAATSAQILDDVRDAVDLIEKDSIFKPTDLAVGPLEWNRLIAPETLVGYAPNLLTHIREAYGLNVVKWERLRAIPAADAVNGAPVARAVFYEKTQDVFHPLITAAPEQYPPKTEDLGYSVVVHQRTGGVESTQPLGAYYVDMA